ncbi:phage antirepressor [Porphyromonas sp.]
MAHKPLGEFQQQERWTPHFFVAMLRTPTVLKQTELLGQQFAVYGTPQEPLFKAQEVASMLSLKNVSDMIQRVDEEERSKLNLGRQGETWMLTENGLYEVLMQSRKPIAKSFKKGVKSILKEIRTNGGYIATQPEDTPELIMARALMVAQSTIEKSQRQLQAAQAVITSQSEQLKEQAPKVEYTDNVLNAATTYTSTQMAKELDLRTAEQLHALLKSWGVMIRQSGQWMLAAKYCGQNYTKTRTHPYTKQDGTQGTNSITVWTERGRWFLHNLMQQKGGVA